MRTMKDLERVDRATLRLWRATNVVGWWAVGALVYHAIAILLGRTFVQKIAFLSSGYGPTAALLLTFGFAAITAGAIVGARVYRSPFVVAGLAVLIPDGLLLLFILAGPMGWPEIGIIALYVLVPAAVTALTARAVWRHRPGALRLR
jgi:hypothetical protein